MLPHEFSKLLLDLLLSQEETALSPIENEVLGKMGDRAGSLLRVGQHSKIGLIVVDHLRKKLRVKRAVEGEQMLEMCLIIAFILLVKLGA